MEGVSYLLQRGARFQLGLGEGAPQRTPHPLLPTSDQQNFVANFWQRPPPVSSPLPLTEKITADHLTGRPPGEGSVGATVGAGKV